VTISTPSARRQFVLEAHHLRRQAALIILVVHRQVVDACEDRVEFAGAEPYQSVGELAVDGIAAIAADNHGDFGRMRGAEHG
jgi:hypothetical protein